MAAGFPPGFSLWHEQCCCDAPTLGVPRHRRVRSKHLAASRSGAAQIPASPPAPPAAPASHARSEDKVRHSTRPPAALAPRSRGSTLASSPQSTPRAPRTPAEHSVRNLITAPLPTNKTRTARATASTFRQANPAAKLPGRPPPPDEPQDPPEPPPP